jgi:long-chain acyl-CoA synthetase
VVQGTSGQAPGASSGPGYVVARLARQVELALTDTGLSVSQYRVLARLAEGSVEASVLAAHLWVKGPSVTAVIDGLAARGLVERHETGTDRRCVSHTLTDEGERMLREADAASEARLAHIAQAGGASAATQAFAGLAAWGAALDAHREARMRTRQEEGPVLDPSRQRGRRRSVATVSR